MRDVLNTACNITNAINKGVVRVEREGGWVNDAFRHRRPSCMHSGPDRWPRAGPSALLTIPRGEQTSSGNSFGPQATLLMHPSGPTGSELVLHGFIGLEKAVCKMLYYNISLMD